MVLVVIPNAAWGRSEPPPKTRATKATATWLLTHAPVVWFDCLTAVVCEGERKRALSGVLPANDIGRVRAFILF
jgi:hypothetical protein